MCKVLEGMSAALQWGVWSVGSQNNKERPGQGCLEGVPCTGRRRGSCFHLDVFVDFPSVVYRRSPSRRKNLSRVLSKLLYSETDCWEKQLMTHLTAAYPFPGFREHSWGFSHKYKLGKMRVGLAMCNMDTQPVHFPSLATTPEAASPAHSDCRAGPRTPCMRTSSF